MDDKLGRESAGLADGSWDAGEKRAGYCLVFTLSQGVRPSPTYTCEVCGDKEETEKVTGQPPVPSKGTVASQRGCAGIALTAAQASFKADVAPRDLPVPCQLVTGRGYLFPRVPARRCTSVISGAVGGCGVASPDVHIRIPGSCARYLRGVRGFAVGVREGR